MLCFYTVGKGRLCSMGFPLSCRGPLGLVAARG